MVSTGASSRVLYGAWLNKAGIVDTDKLVSIKGLVIRATPVIPDMKLGKPLLPT